MLVLRFFNRCIGRFESFLLGAFLGSLVAGAFILHVALWMLAERM